MANLRLFCRHLSLFSSVMGPVFVSGILREADGHWVSAPGYSKLTGSILENKRGGYCIFTGTKQYLSAQGDYDLKSCYCGREIQESRFQKKSKIPIGWHQYLEVEDILPLPALCQN